MDTREYTLLGILQHLFTQAEKGTSVADLAQNLAVSEADVVDAIDHLRTRGLVNEPLRLTMSGLAAASALSGARRSRRCAA